MVKIIKNQKGQAVTEYILLVVVSVMISKLAFKILKDPIKEMVQNPVGKIKGMVECGVWEDISTAKKFHPNSFARGVSYRPN